MDENKLRAEKNLDPLPIERSPAADWVPPGSSRVGIFQFTCYHAAVFVVERLMHNTGAGAPEGVRPFGNVDTRLLWLPLSSSTGDPQFYPQHGSPAPYFLAHLPEVNSAATWCLSNAATTSVPTAVQYVAALQPLVRDALIAGGTPSERDAFFKVARALSLFLSLAHA